MRFTSIIFDFDGTLADSRQDIAGAQLWVMQQLGLEGVREEDLYPHIGKPLDETFEQFLPLSMRWRVPEAAQMYAEYYPSRSLATTRLFPGVRETLEILSARGAAMAIASTKRGSGIKRATDHFGAFHSAGAGRSDPDRAFRTASEDIRLIQQYGRRRHRN